MGAFDHKGRCLYANTPLAAMLGYTIKVLRSKDIAQLLPQPYGVLHLKWLKVCVWRPERALSREPSCCRVCLGLGRAQRRPKRSAQRRRRAKARARPPQHTATAAPMHACRTRRAWRASRRPTAAAAASRA